MDFQKLVEIVGLPAAFTAAMMDGKEYSVAPKTFKDWLAVLTFSLKGSQSHALALRKIEVMAEAFDQWFEVYRCTTVGRELKVKALTKMAETAEAFDQWCFDQWYEGHDFFDWRSDDGETLRALALKKMGGKARTFDQWYKVYSRATGSELEAAALKKMKELGADFTFDQWLEVYRSNEKIRNLAFQEMKRLGTYEQWEATLAFFSNEIRDHVLQIMNELRTFDQWWQFCLSHRHANSSALAGLVRTASTFDQYRKVYGVVSSFEDNEFKIAVLKKMEELGKDFTFDQWREVYKKAPSLPNCPKLKTLALEKMCETASTFDQWFQVYYLAPSRDRLIYDRVVEIGSPDSTLLASVLQKMEGLGTFDQWYKAYCCADKFRTSAPGCALPDNELKATALREMEKIGTFDHWHEVFKNKRDNMKDGRALENRASEKAEELSKDFTFDQWLAVFNSALPDSWLKVRALQKIGEFLD